MKIDQHILLSITLKEDFSKSSSRNKDLLSVVQACLKSARVGDSDYKILEGSNSFLVSLKLLENHFAKFDECASEYCIVAPVQVAEYY